MLGRAIVDKRASESLPPRMTAQADLALKKQLFPSSSPSATQDGNIADHFKKPRHPSSSAARSSGANNYSNSSAPNIPLAPRSQNVSYPSNGRPHQQPSHAGAKSFASLYSKADSFREEPVVIDLVRDDNSNSRGKNTAYVYIDEDDISDDDKLLEDLEVARPSALPPVPMPRPSPKPAETQNTISLDPTSSSALSWSQSSPSHRLPVPGREPIPSQITSKRSSPDEIEDPLPVAKKRAKPKHWMTHEKEEVVEDDDSGTTAFARTPSSKFKTALPWNTTASAVKAQQKQLRSQQKKPSAGAEVSAEDIQQVVQSHSVKSTAILLSEEQCHVKNLVINKSQSVFFTGPAGTGKSVLMRAIIQELKKKWARDPERLAVTASTGLAACNIGGMTLHSFAGIGLGKEDAQTLVKKIRRNPKAKNRWLKTKTLIIDEVSMVDGDLFDKLSQIGRTIRNNGRPWGGIQLVITGDFFQLPPVPDAEKSREVKFAFEAATWNTSIDHTIGLTQVFRQKDPEFAQMLNEMRLGRISEQTVRAFQSMSRPLSFDDGLEVTELFPTRHEVENSNDRRLRALSGKAYKYEAQDSGELAIRDKLLANMMAPKSIMLKKGAQVMLIKNLDETLVNGSLGTVYDFMNETTYELVGGQADDVHDDEVDPKVKQRIKAFSRELDADSSRDNNVYPAVRFHAVDGSQRTILCRPEDWKVELPTGQVQASRKQLPLILAWALSIHKAQGQTLERVKVDLGRVFEKGQAYVALSRATTQHGLQVLRFDKQKVMAHPRVVQFYNKLYTAEAAIKKKTAASMASFVYKPKSVPEDYGIPDDDEEAIAAAYG